MFVCMFSQYVSIQVLTDTVFHANLFISEIFACKHVSSVVAVLCNQCRTEIGASSDTPVENLIEYLSNRSDRRVRPGILGSYFSGFHISLVFYLRS